MVSPEPDGREAMFKIIKAVASEGVSARLGTLTLPKRRPIDTPNFIGLTARGAIPHLTPDNVSNKSELGGVYLALEDFIETSKKKKFPPLLEIGSAKSEPHPLHAYTATPSHVFTILGARRHAAINAPLGNAKDSISVFTSTGFQRLTNQAYCESVDAINPDVVIPLADMTYSRATGFAETKKRTNPNGSKRQVRMVERTEDWLAEFFSEREDSGAPAVFAPLLPISYPTQWEYFNQLEQDFADRLSGLAVYDTDVVPDISNHAPLVPLPRLSMDYVATPHEILRQIHLGMDLFTISFLNSISDSGVALSFTFPPPPLNPEEDIFPLGIDMWSPTHSTAVLPLIPSCKCHACTKHHRAYLHHLLNAKEMLGWTLLQIHNYHVMGKFFAGVRDSLRAGDFERDHDRFARVYDSELPVGTGTRPRARGYHFKSTGGDEPINAPAWEKFDDGVAGEGEGGEDAAVLVGEMNGLVVTGAKVEGGQETPLVPDADAEELDRKGFAEIER